MAAAFDDGPPEWATESIPERGKLAAVPAPPKRAVLLDHSFWLQDAQVSAQLPYVVKGIFGRGQIVVFWGSPGNGKTFVTMDLAAHIGSGENWHGRRTKRGIVLYVAAESSRVYIENRIAAIRLERPHLAQAEVLFIPLALDLLHEENGDVNRVIDAAQQVAQDYGEVALIIIDTLAVTFGGGNENGPEDMGAYVHNIQYIRDQTGAAILIVHHTGKDEARGMRGHSSLLGALDAELSIEGKPGEEKILKTGKVRDGDGQADIFSFSLQRVELAIDDDGDMVTTCIVKAGDQEATQRARRKARGSGLGKHQKAVLKAVEQAGGRMSRLDLGEAFKADGVPRQRLHEAIAILLESGMLVAVNGLTSDVALPEKLSINA